MNSRASDQNGSPPQSEGDGAALERAPKPPSLWDTVQAQVDRAFADFIGGDYPPASGTDPEPRGDAGR